MASLSAVEWTATVWMPISRQARWMRSAISPRLAMRTLSNIAAGPVLLDDHQRLAELHGLRVVDQHLRHRARLGGLDRIEGLHRLDDEQRLCGSDLVADAHEHRFARFGREIGGSDHWRFHRAGMLGRVVGRGYGRAGGDR